MGEAAASATTDRNPEIREGTRRACPDQPVQGRRVDKYAGPGYEGRRELPTGGCDVRDDREGGRMAAVILSMCLLTNAARNSPATSAMTR